VATRCLIVDDNRLRPDVTLVDIDLGSESGFDLVRRLLDDHRRENRASRAPDEPFRAAAAQPSCFLEARTGGAAADSPSVRSVPGAQADSMRTATVLPSS